jgi:hypothetical protein
LKAILSPCTTVPYLLKLMSLLFSV